MQMWFHDHGGAGMLYSRGFDIYEPVGIFQTKQILTDLPDLA